MSLIVTGNRVSKDILIDPIVAHTGFYDVSVNNNSVDGDLIIRADGIYGNIKIDHCDFRVDLKYFSPEVWFIYHNFYVNRMHSMKQVLKDYEDGGIYSLTFNYYPNASTNLPKLAIDCLEFLKEYYVV